jgi:pyruvate dehydrogenase E1 component alpha subunit
VVRETLPDAMTTEAAQLDRDGTPARGLTTAARRGLYAKMVLNRAFETEAERQYKAARIGGYCHLSSGQEATTAGVVHALENADLLVTGYRCHGFALARGVSPATVMAELFGRSDGCSHGRGGSMHLQDVSRGFYGGWGIVGGQLPVATGLALALVRQDKHQVVLCELGDGAVNIGAWHESLNLAALWNLPVVFLVVNNGYGMGTAVEHASAEPEIHKRASAFRMHGERVDGDDLDAVVEAADRLLRAAREKRRPAVLEAVTYRYRGHSVADAGVAYRPKHEISEHLAHDPIVRVRERLWADGLDQEELEGIAHVAEESVAAAVEFALASPEPPADRLAWGVHARGSDVQFVRMRPGSAFGEETLVFDSGLGT